MCIPSHCTALRGVPDPNRAPVLPEPGSGRVTEAVLGFISKFSFGEGDPRGVSSVIAFRLAESLDSTGRPDVARELETVLSHLGAAPDEEADALDELATKRHVRRLAEMLAESGRDVREGWK
jgi:hypothetical protein